jgi:hypothetical protein
MWWLPTRAHTRSSTSTSSRRVQTRNDYHDTQSHNIVTYHPFPPSVSRSVKQFHLLLYGLEIEVLQHALLLQLLFHWNLDVTHEFLFLGGFVIQVFYIMLHELELQCVSDFYISELLQLLPADLP